MTWNSSAKAQLIGPYIESVLGCKSLDYVLISHFHLDHIGYVGYGGLWHLVEMQEFTVGTTLVRDYGNYLGDTSGTFTNWKTYLESDGQTTLHPVTAMEGTSQVNLGAGVTFNIVAANGNGALIAGNYSDDSNPPSENDYSIGAVLSYGNFDEWIGGDLSGHYEVGDFGYTYHDIELSAAPEVGDVDVYKANHHGSSHSSSATFINQIDPEVSIVTTGNGNNYGHPAQSTMDRLLATSTVYMTERGDTHTNIGSAIVAGNIVIKTSNGSTYTVNGTPFLATEPTRTDADGDGYFAQADPNDNNSGTIPAPNGGCDPLYQTCSASCQVTAGQVLINEVLPSSGTEWVELYNTTDSTLNIGYCVIDDSVDGSPAYQIPASTLIPARGFWTLDRVTYFNNPGDDVRFLKEDASTVLDNYTYENPIPDLSWYRFPDGGNWAPSPTASTTKGQTNTIPFYPIVSSIVRADENPTDADSVTFILTFSKAVTGVNASVPFNDFALSTTGITDAYITAVNGAGAIYTITVSTGSGNGPIRLDVVDDDSTRDANNHPLGGAGAGNGNFIRGETYTIDKPTNVDVYIGEELKGEYFLDSNESTRQSYVSTNDGPVQIKQTDSNPMIAAERVIYKINGTPTSFTEMMALPDGQLDSTYWLPWYNNVDLDTQLRFGNVSATTATVYVSIGGVPMVGSPFTLAPGESTRQSFAGINNGPVKIVSNVDIVAAERVIYTVNGLPTSFSEMMALPNSQLNTTYWLPWYNNVDLDTQLRIGNVSGSTAMVNVYIGNVLRTAVPIVLQSGQSTRVSFPGINDGPVKIVSKQNIVAAERVIYNVSGAPTSFSEMMGLPKNQLNTRYWLPWYDNVFLDTQLRIGNVSSSTATVHIYLGGLEVADSPFTLASGASTRRSYPGVNKGPVEIVSNVNIVAAERVIYMASGIPTSFSEMMGLPNSQLNTTYWLPWYNNVDLDTQLRFGL